MKKNVANIITGCRILLSIALLFPAPLSTAFYAVYIAAGITDMIDGTAARKLNAATSFGAKLDTVADFTLFASCAVKLFPILDIPLWLWIWIGVIALIKLISIVSGFIMRKSVVVLHTAMNKITGLLLFIFPLTLYFLDIKYTAPVVCEAATFAAMQEGHFIRTKKDMT